MLKKYSKYEIPIKKTDVLVSMIVIIKYKGPHYILKKRDILNNFYPFKSFYDLMYVNILMFMFFFFPSSPVSDSNGRLQLTQTSGQRMAMTMSLNATYLSFCLTERYVWHQAFIVLLLYILISQNWYSGEFDTSVKKI